MRRPDGTWTTELGRQSGYANADLPANAQKAITLQMYARDGQLRGRYSLDDGATWTEIGDGFDTSGLGAPSVGLAAYNGTGSETATFEAFTVGEPPELPPVPPCETPNVPEAGYSALFDGTDASLQQFKYSGSGSFVRQGCTIKSVGGFGLMYTKQSYKAPYSLKLDWMMPGDDNSGIFVGFPDTGANTVDTRSPTAKRSRSTRRTTRPRPPARSTSSRRRTSPPATRCSSRPGSGTRTSSSSRPTASS